MRRTAIASALTLATLAALAAVAGCGGSTPSTGTSGAPSDQFVGTWVGTVTSGDSTATVTLMTTQSGSTISGTGNVASGHLSLGLTVTGTSTPPSVSLTAIAPLVADTIAFTGSYITADSVAGTAVTDGETVPLSLKKQ